MITAADSNVPSSEPPRRSFFYKVATVMVSAVVGLFPLAAGLAMFLDPLRSRGTNGENGNWLRIATLDQLPADGLPRQFPVIDDLVDAWNRTPNQPVGSVFLRRKGGTREVAALNAICPHAGCLVAIGKNREGEENFACPCHRSAFSLEGEKLDLPDAANPSPRDMDQLEVDQEKLNETGEIWVNFKNFYPGIHDQVEKG